MRIRTTYTLTFTMDDNDGDRESIQKEIDNLASYYSDCARVKKRVWYLFWRKNEYPREPGT